MIEERRHPLVLRVNLHRLARRYQRTARTLRQTLARLRRELKELQQGAQRGRALAELRERITHASSDLAAALTASDNLRCWCDELALAAAGA